MYTTDEKKRNLSKITYLRNKVSPENKAATDISLDTIAISQCRIFIFLANCPVITGIHKLLDIFLNA